MLTLRDLTCPGCGAPVRLEEKASYRAGKMIYHCRPCLRRFGLAAGPGAVRRGAAAASATRRLRAQRRTLARTSSLTELISPSEREPLPAGVSLTLELVEGPDRGRSIKVHWSRCVLGREEAEIAVGDPSVSRRHAMLEVYDAETVLFKDLASTNGSFQNGRLIDHCKLQDGDEIRIGSTVLSVVLEAAA